MKEWKGYWVRGYKSETDLEYRERKPKCEHVQEVKTREDEQTTFHVFTSSITGETVTATARCGYDRRIKNLHIILELLKGGMK